MQVTTGKAEASFSQQSGNQVRSPVFGEQDDWTRLYDFIQPLVLRRCFQMEAHTHREWKQYWIVKKGKLCFLEKLLFSEHRQGFGVGRKAENKRSLVGMKRQYNGLAAAFISHACHNMYIFASDGNPSITRGLSDHDGYCCGGGCRKKSMCDVASGSLQPLRSGKTCTPSLSVLLWSPTEVVQK